MKEYRAKKRAVKNETDKKQKSINTLTDAIRAQKARQELLSRAIESANKTANRLTEIGSNAKELIQRGKNMKETPKKRGRPSKVQNYYFIV